ncbi:MAG: hypothetical protein HYT73_02540 [Candidatus Aenigmarchaeota archaeon]|nr:hypothetical protein [Candidatus Aenigmarchaeota archaeon]
MPKYDFCDRCEKELPPHYRNIPWYSAFDGLCAECMAKVRERLGKATDEFERSLRRDNVPERDIRRLSNQFRETLAREE